MRVATRAVGIEVGIAGIAVRLGSAGLVFMRVVADVLLGRAVRFVQAISCHRRSGPLQRQDEQKKEGYELAHVVEANTARAWRTSETEAFLSQDLPSRCVQKWSLITSARPWNCYV